MLEDVILENEQILLRPMTRQDFPLLLDLSREKSLWDYFTHDLSSPEGFEDWAVPTFSGERLQFTIIDKESTLPIGSSAFGNFSPKDKRVEIGWTWLGKDFHGKGYNRQIKFLMFEYAFEVQKMLRVELKTDVLNTPARKAMLAMGIREEGILRSHTLLCSGRRRDTIYYSLLADEWESAKKDWYEKRR